MSVGALGDSFYEYLIKSWLATEKEDVEAKSMYDAAVEALQSQLRQKSASGLVSLFVCFDRYPQVVCNPQKTS